MASLGSTPGLIVAAGVGAAASAALNPAFEVPKQEAWTRNPQRLLDTGTIAQLVARGGVLLGKADGSTSGSGYAEARRQGHAASRLDRLVWLAQRMPDYGTLRALSNRKLLADGQLAEALNRHAYPADWQKPLTDLFSEILSPGEIAAAIHRGLIPAPTGLLRGQQPEPPFKVDEYPVYDIDALAEALGHGYDRDRLGVLVGLQGLPMGPHEAAQAVFREIITFGDYIRAFNESNNRNEWAQAIYEQSKQIPTSRDFFENALRGYHSLAWAQKQAQRHGMSEADSLVIYQNQGRPMNLQQITQALARGGVFKPEPGEQTNPYMASIIEGNLKPAYYDLAYARRYTLPTAFAIRGLAQAGTWDEAKVALRLKELGWLPEDADDVAKAWTGGAGAGSTSPRVKLAATQAVAALKRQWMNEATDEAGVLNGLQTVGETAEDADAILNFWTYERLWTEKPLTPANVKKAYKAGDFPIDEATARLVAQQWSAADATTYLTT